jgi:tRNA (cytidine32/uridine32-2'-O)-methyltransferase
MLHNVSIILVETSHAGNIGAAARAMKTMGLSQLILVNPEANFPSGEATALAVGADNILENARVVSTLDEALMGMQLIIGTSARLREIPLRLLSPRESASMISQTEPNTKVALLFGREYAGLTNDELNRCHYHVHIPTNPDFSSLNLAAAVQILSYELQLAALEINSISPVKPQEHDRLATDDEIQTFYQHLETLLQDVNFLKTHSPRKLMPRLKRLFNRIAIEKMEFDLLMGILKAIRRTITSISK